MPFLIVAIYLYFKEFLMEQMAGGQKGSSMSDAYLWNSAEPIRNSKIVTGISPEKLFQSPFYLGAISKWSNSFPLLLQQGPRPSLI